jgi:hypothetical protein
MTDDETGEQRLANTKTETPGARIAHVVQAAEAYPGERPGRVHDQGMVTRQGRMSISANRPAMT